jgi:hypothetical protein
MKKKKKEKKGPSGMVKRTKFIKSGPAAPPPDIGAVVWYPNKKGAWRTGRLIRVIDRGKDWGKCEVKDSETGSLVAVLPELVRSPEKTPKKSLERGV